MRLVPETNERKIQFFRSHLQKWEEHAEQIGTTPQMVAELAALTDEAFAARAALRAAQSAARAARLRADMALENMAAKGSIIIKQIRTQAALEGEGVYLLAQIAAPEKASPMGELGTPTEFTVELGEDGTLELRWKCKNPRGATGAIYNVHRRSAPGRRFELLGAVGQKSFKDSTIPPGATQLTYRVQAIRSTSVGPMVEHNVNFGTHGSNLPTFTVSSGGPVQVAA